MLLALEFDPQKADEPQPRPPPEKIAEMIQTCDCFVAIISKRTKVAAVDGWVGPEWVQNEIGMAYQAGKPMAIFVEEGVEKKHWALGDRLRTFRTFRLVGERAKRREISD